MKILFLCPSLDPGCSGVGDYTRRLAAECIRQGHAAGAVSLNEPGIDHAVYELQNDSGKGVPVLRLPSALSWDERWTKAREWPEAALAEVVSLQFVCFGFHPKGLIPIEFGRQVRRMAGARPVQIMFHELWLGLPVGSSFKHCLWGWAQRWLIEKMLRALKPEIIQTNTEPYCEILKRRRWNAMRLPLFGNIPVNPAGEDWRGLSAELAGALGSHVERGAIWLVGIFGSLHPEWRPMPLARAFAEAAESAGKQIVFLLMGRHGRQSDEIGNWQINSPAGVTWVVLGEQEPGQLSRWFQICDFGAVSTPLSHLEKSGSAAALLEHGLPLVVCREDCRFGEGIQTPPRETARHHVLDQGLPVWIGRIRRVPARSALSDVCAEFVKTVDLRCAS
jgi:hypothetical protein